MPRRVLPTLALAFLLVGGATALAQKYEIYQKTLTNGLDVIVIHNPSVPLVTVEINVHNGAYTESPEFSGLSHLYEHMFFKANKVIPSQERYLERIRELGASWNGSTGDERVNYFFTIPRDSLVPALVFMYNAITSPLFLQEELVKERPVVTGEYDRAESNPFFLLNRAVSKQVWWKYYTRKNPLGERDVILSATTAKMQTIEQRYYVPNNSALILAGDISPEEGFRLAEKYFLPWKRGADPFVANPVPEHPPIQKTETTVVEAPVNAVTIMMVWQGPSVRKDPRATYAADVLSFILNQHTSQFYKDLVESGLTYGVNLTYQTEDQKGAITLFAQTSADKFEKCRTAVMEELKKMGDPGYFNDAQLENAKTILAIDEEYGRERPSQYSHTVGFWWAVAGLDYYLSYVDNLKKATRQDIAYYLNTYVNGKPYVMGVLSSSQDRKKLGL
jgi:zinc protease